MNVFLKIGVERNLVGSNSPTLMILTILSIDYYRYLKYSINKIIISKQLILFYNSKN